MGLKHWLQLTRAHTAPLEAVPAAIGGLLATGGSVTGGVIGWTIFGLLYHLSGYGMNSLRDWQKGFDQNDPYKQHHPLNSGDLYEEIASEVVVALFVVTISFAAVGAILSPHTLLTISLISVAVLFGVAYNEIGKYTKHKYIFISVAHSMVFAIPYVALGGGVDEVLLFGTLSVFMWVVYQISISGEIKDIVQDGEENILRSMGVTVTDVGDYSVINTPRRVQFIAAAERWVLMVFCGMLAVFAGRGEVSIHLTMLIGLLTMILSVSLLSTGEYDRNSRLLKMSVMEIGSMSMFCMATVGVIHPYGVLTILVGSGLWLVCFNLVEWGSLVAPEV